MYPVGGESQSEMKIYVVHQIGKLGVGKSGGSDDLHVKSHSASCMGSA